MFQNEDDAKLLLGARTFERVSPTITTGSGVDLETFVPDPEERTMPRDRPLRVMFIGRVVKEKGIVEFMDAAAALHRRGVAAEFVVCGDRDAGNRSVVDEESYNDWVHEGAVQFLGHQDDMAKVLRTADIVVLPSYREGTPRTLMEASAMGKPIVATDVPGCREVALEGQNAILVPARDANALANAIARMLDDSDLRRRLSTGGRMLAKRYDVRHINEQILAAYKSSGRVRLPGAVRTADASIS